MHNVSIQKIKELATNIAALSETVDSQELIANVRELYEMVILFHHTEKKEPLIDSSKIVTSDNENTTITDSTYTKTEESENEKELSIQERIEQIMNASPKFETKKAEITEVTPTDNNSDDIIEEIETPKEIHTPVKDLKEEFEDAIAADYAADLFEKADKREITKKSLNDRLSQSHIQIGLNDRIAFVKHLFNDNQADFNRVLSQLNSFQSYDEAINFIDNIVKPDYKWEQESTYVERFMMLVERRFI